MSRCGRTRGSHCQTGAERRSAVAKRGNRIEGGRICSTGDSRIVVKGRGSAKLGNIESPGGAHAHHGMEDEVTMQQPNTQVHTLNFGPKHCPSSGGIGGQDLLGIGDGRSCTGPNGRCVPCDRIGVVPIRTSFCERLGTEIASPRRQGPVLVCARSRGETRLDGS